MQTRVPFAALALVLAAAPLAAQRAEVAGQVVDAGTRAPLAAAVIEIPGSGVEVLTGQDGHFQFRLRPGSYGLTVSRMGYEDLLLTVEVAGESADLGTIALRADPVMLEAIEATVDRIERQRLSVATPSRVFGIDELTNTAAFNAADFVALRSGLSTTCVTSPFGSCASFRGSATRTCVVVDDSPMPGGLASLMVYQPRDFARINVYRRGVFVQAYTPAYLERLARSRYHPMPASLQMLAYCRFNSV